MQGSCGVVEQFKAEQVDCSLVWRLKHEAVISV